MTTARIAVIFSVIFSLLFLLSYSSHVPYLPDEDPSTAAAVRDRQEIDNNHRTAVLLPVDKSSDGASIPTVYLSRQFAHSLRLPISRHFQRPLAIRRGCRHHARRPIGGGVYERTVEIPYGSDMIPFPGEWRPLSTIEADGRQISKEEVREWNPEVDWVEIEHKEKKKKRKKERKEKEEHEEIEHKKKKDEEETKGGRRFHEAVSRVFKPLLSWFPGFYRVRALVTVWNIVLNPGGTLYIFTSSSCCT